MIDPSTPPTNVDQALSDLADMVVNPLATQRLLASAYPPAQHAPRRRWLLPLSFAAALLISVAISLPFLQSRASAADALATTLQANQGYQGWVQMTFRSAAQTTNTKRWNTATGISATRYESPQKYSVEFINPTKGQIADYSSTTGLIRIGDLSPDSANSYRETAAALPVSYLDLLDQIRRLLCENAVTIAQSPDRGMTRFDFTPINKKQVQPGGAWAGPLPFPSAIWADPKTGLIQEALISGKTLTFSYGGPNLQSIYDAGVPRTANLYDNRPSPETIAVCDRLEANLSKPLPDGVAARLQETDGKNAYLQLYAYSGPGWWLRAYDVEPPAAPVHAATPADHLTLDAFIQQFNLKPFFQIIGDANTASPFQFDDPNLYSPVSGRTAKDLHAVTLPANWLYPSDALRGRYYTSDHVDLLTSPDRPGLIALHLQLRENIDQITGDIQYWLDPAHNDRPVYYEEISYTRTPAGEFLKTPSQKVVTEFHDYLTLPAPDSRSVPSAWTETTYKFDAAGKPTPSSTNTMSFYFFPNQAMPPLPPTTMPRP